MDVIVVEVRVVYIVVLEEKVAKDKHKESSFESAIGCGDGLMKLVDLGDETVVRRFRVLRGGMSLGGRALLPMDVVGETSGAVLQRRSGARSIFRLLATDADHRR